MNAAPIPLRPTHRRPPRAAWFSPRGAGSLDDGPSPNGRPRGLNSGARYRRSGRAGITVLLVIVALAAGAIGGYWLPTWRSGGGGSSEATGPTDAADAELGSQLLDGNAGLIEFDKIVSVRRYPFSGHVYNLETEEGWYAASGLIVHNCRCWIEFEDPSTGAFEQVFSQPIIPIAAIGQNVIESPTEET